jgi:hypothetical protein
MKTYQNLFMLLALAITALIMSPWAAATGAHLIIGRVDAIKRPRMPIPPPRSGSTGCPLLIYGLATAKHWIDTGRP